MKKMLLVVLLAALAFHSECGQKTGGWNEVEQPEMLEFMESEMFKIAETMAR